MIYTTKRLPNSELSLTITIAPADYAATLPAAAKRLSEKREIKGFRRGHAPYDIVKSEMGETAILEEAIADIVRPAFVEAVQKEAVETIGMPQISVDKLAPGNDFVFTATVALLPKVELADPKKLTTEKKARAISEEAVEETLTALRGMQAVEVAVDHGAEKTDKVVLDLMMKLDGVPVDGGQAQDYQVYLSEKQYIPGLNEEIIGLKKGETKTFSLTFPESHYQKHLAGKEVEITVTIKDVFERRLPELTDAFAKTLGQESVAALSDRVRANLTEEQEHKAEQAFEIALLKEMIEASSFEPIPAALISAEREKIFFELKNSLEKNGIPIARYLADLKKTEQELFADFTVQATERAKAALLSRQIAKEHGIVSSEDDIQKEIAAMREVYKEDEETLKKLDLPEVKDSIAVHLQNRKAIEWLKEQIKKIGDLSRRRRD